MKPILSPKTVVRSRKDGATGHVIRSHRELPGDPVQVLVKWRDGTYMWHAPDTLELLMNPTASVTTLLVDGEVSETVESQKTYVGRRLAKMREMRGFSQLTFAAKVGLSNDRIADMEIGRSDMRMSTFIHLCKVLNVDPGEFLALGTGTKKKREKKT
jgi:DNA-binding XRE family transcriptional regulator